MRVRWGREEGLGVGGTLLGGGVEGVGTRELSSAVSEDNKFSVCSYLIVLT